MQQSTRLMLIISVLLTLFLITACGGSDDATDTPTTIESATSESNVALTAEVTTESNAIEATVEVDQSTQAQDENCPELVRVALAQVTDVCSNTGRNEICYGNTDMNITAMDNIETLTFENPGDVTNLINMQSIELSPMDTADNVWGIALMRIQANLEGTLAGQNVTFLLFGDVQLENRSDDLESGVQSFYFQSGVGDAQCAEAPASGMLVQTPDGVAQVSLNINDVAIELGSTAYIQAEPDSQMQISVVEGEALVRSGGESQRVFAGNQTVITLDSDGNADSAPSEPEPYEIEPLQALPIEPLERDFTIALPNQTTQESAGVGVEINGELTEIGQAIYEFDAESGQTVFLDNQEGDGANLRWRLDAPNGVIISDWQRIDQDHESIALDQTGTYSVIVASQPNEGIGAYQFTIWEVPEPEAFNADIGSAYGGDIGTVGAIHNYEFTVTAGQTLFIDAQDSDGSQLSWHVKDAEGNIVVDDTRADADSQATFETAGTYTLVIYGRGGGVGAYQFQLWDVPEAEAFDAEIGASNPDENSAIYNGSIETIGAIHHYSFTAEAEQTTFIANIESAGSTLSWSVMNSDGQTVVEAQRADANIEFTAETADTYTLTVFGIGDGIGNYQFQIWNVPDFTLLDYTLGEVIAGEIVTPGQSIGYTFEASAGDVLYFEAIEGAGSTVLWLLETLEGEIIQNQTRVDVDLGEIIIQEDGEYTLLFFGADEGVGAYSVRVWNTDIQPEDLTADLSEVIIGSIDAGEQVAFTLLLEQDTTLYFSSGGEVGGAMTWQLQDEDWNIIIEPTRLWFGNDVEAIPLRAGGYTITIAGETEDDAGLYQFAVWDADVTDSIEYEIGQLVDENGTGNISQAGEVDRYSFTLTDDEVVVFMALMTEEDQGFNWSLYDARNNPVFEDEGIWFGNRIGDLTLDAGTYTLDVYGSGSDTGYYGFQSWFITAPDYNEIGLGAVISDGQPQAGAGHIEAVGGQDSYLLILDAPAEVSFIALGEDDDASILWSVHDPDGNALFVDEGLWEGNELGPFSLDAGAYNIVTYGYVNSFGTYSFEIREE